MRLQKKIQPHSHANGQQRKNELLQGQSEKHRFRIVSDFFIDLDFQMNPSL